MADTYSIIEVLSERWTITSSGLSQLEAQTILQRKSGNIVNAGAPMIAMRTDADAVTISAAEDQRVAATAGAAKGGIPDYRIPGLLPPVNVPFGNQANQISPDMPVLNPTPDQPTTSEAS